MDKGLVLNWISTAVIFSLSILILRKNSPIVSLQKILFIFIFNL